MEQLAARWAHNPKVTSSSLVPATTQSENEVIHFRFFTIITLRMNYYRFIAYGGAKYNTDKVVGLMMNTKLKGAEQLVRGGKVTQSLPDNVAERRWFGLEGQSASGVLIDELKNGNVELYYPNDFGCFTDALVIFLLLLTYAQLDIKVQIIAPDGTITDNLLTKEAADVERRMSDWLKQQLIEKCEIAKKEGKAELTGFHCSMTITREELESDYMGADEDEMATRLFNKMVALQWS